MNVTLAAYGAAVIIGGSILGLAIYFLATQVSIILDMSDWGSQRPSIREILNMYEVGFVFRPSSTDRAPTITTGTGTAMTSTASRGGTRVITPAPAWTARPAR